MTSLSSRIARIAVASLLTASALTGTACATHNDETIRYRVALERGDYKTAEKELETSPPAQSDRNRVLYLLDKGMLFHLSKRPDPSNKVFTDAEELAEKYWVTSITETAAQFLVGEDLTSYAGEDYERVQIHVYRAYNYLLLGNLDEALVECRQLDSELTEINKRYADNPNRYREDAFARWLSGILYEAGGDYNDAAISYRKALGIYEKDYAKLFNVRAPWQLKLDYLRALKLADLLDEFNEVSPRYPDLLPFVEPLPKDHGEVVFIHQNGRAPYKVEDNVVLPFPDGTVVRLAYPRYERARYAVRYADLTFTPSITSPSIASPTSITPASITPTDATPIITNAALNTATTKFSGRTELAQDLGQMAIVGLDDAKGRYIARSIARGVAKFAAKKAAEKAHPVLGLLVNVASVATERADTRSWLTLPGQFDLARVRLPAGAHDMTITLMSAQGYAVGTRTIKNITVEPGKRTFLTERTWQ